MTRDTVIPDAKPDLERAGSSEEMRKGRSGLREAPSRVTLIQAAFGKGRYRDQRAGFPSRICHQVSAVY